ncbi:meiosis regulator and mRNA stability factor 1-like isoform X2 [Gigantopelta aegis]|uniref:meiosis regulator and mRNA stability factor 1-like isoform X2 n=1 Tax=Gigantopelta aegis TaxID=1735272 RepID=UPI001B88B27A|nr:meiosis regulator and mRNA stability factor 1-like isoform X2 [Gigantopelta aegis]
MSNSNNSIVSIGVFWDIENVHVPKWKSAFSVVQCIRDRFFSGLREVEFMCVCDIHKESKDVIQELNSAQVNVVHINATAKNAADDKIRQSLRRFADTHPAQTKIILISSDVNFTCDLSDLRHRKNFYIILIHKHQVSEALTACANEHYIFDDLVFNLPCRTPSKLEDGLSELMVTGFNFQLPSERIRNRLKTLSYNCGGRVVSVTPDYALVRFSTLETAQRARKRMDGEDVYGNKISVELSTDVNSKENTPGKARKSTLTKCDSFKELKGKNPSSPSKKARVDNVCNRPYRGCSSAPVFEGGNVSDTETVFKKPQTPSKWIVRGTSTSPALRVTAPSNCSGHHSDSATKGQTRADSPGKSAPANGNNKVTLMQANRGKKLEFTNNQENVQKNKTFCDSHNHSFVVSNTARMIEIDSEMVSSSSLPRKQTREMLMLQQQLYQERQLNSEDDETSSSRCRRPNSACLADENNYVRLRFNSGSSSCTSSRPNSEPFGHRNNTPSPYLFESRHRGGLTFRSASNSPVAELNNFNNNNHRDLYPFIKDNQNRNHDHHRSGSFYYNSNYRSYTELKNSYHNCSFQHIEASFSQPASHLLNTSFQPISKSTSPSPTFSDEGGYSDGSLPATRSVELVVSNLDYNISPKEWRKILFTTFHPHVKVLNVHIKTQLDNTSIGMVKVPSVEEARFAISQFHRKKIGYKRIQVTLKNDDSLTAAANIRAEAIALLSEAKGNVLPLFKFIELFDKRYHKTISVSELYKMRDILDIRDQEGSGRMVYMSPGTYRSPTPQEMFNLELGTTWQGTMQEASEVLDQPVCATHCVDGTVFYAEAMNSCMLPYVRIMMKTFATQVHSLLLSHIGQMPLMSFPACYAAEFDSLVGVKEGGVPLEHLISCVPGTQIIVSRCGIKQIQWMENPVPQETDTNRPCNSPMLSQQLNQISREITDLLKHHPQCRMPVSRFIPAYHHHFGRQCRVADYGYTKLIELFEAIPHVLQVLGTGDRKVLTLSHRAQVRRFTADLVRVLKGQPGKRLPMDEFPDAYEKVFGRSWDVTEYGSCYLEDILVEVPASTVQVLSEAGQSYLCIPKREQTAEEIERTKQFAVEVVDLLKHNLQCRMPFNKFIPSYHHHFGKQCKVADYGFSKLTDLFEAIPQILEIEDEGDERILRLTLIEMRKVLCEQMSGLLRNQQGQALRVDDFLPAFACQFGFSLRLEDFGAVSVESLVARFRHLVKIEVYNNEEYVVLLKQTELPPFALGLLQLLMDQSCGCLPLVELCSMYKTTFGTDCDIQTIKDELVDFVEVSGDDGSAVVKLTPLQTLGRNVRLLLMCHGRLLLSELDTMYRDKYGVDINPALHGFSTLNSLLQTLPHIVLLKGRGIKRYIVLSNCLKSTGSGLSTTVSISPLLASEMKADVKGDSDTPSNDSGVTDTQDEDLMITEDKSHWQQDILCAPVPSTIPSPELKPATNQMPDLMMFNGNNRHFDSLWTMTDDEKRGQKTPLCRTPTSDLLQFAAQCLITRPPEEPTSQIADPNTAAGGSQQGSRKADTLAATRMSDSDQSTDLLELLKGGWWKASPEQLQEVSRSLNVPVSGRATPCSDGQTTSTDDSVTKTDSSVSTDDPGMTTSSTLDHTAEMENLVTTATSFDHTLDSGPTNDQQAVFTQVEDSDTVSEWRGSSGDVHNCMALDIKDLSEDQAVGGQENNAVLDVSYDGMFQRGKPLETSSTRSGSESHSGTPTPSPKKSRCRIAAKFSFPLAKPN